MGDLSASKKQGKTGDASLTLYSLRVTGDDLAEGLTGDPTVIVETSGPVKHCGQCSRMPQSTIGSRGYSNCSTGLVSHLLSTSSYHCLPWVTDAPGSMLASC